MKVLYIVHETVPYGANVALINLLDKLIERDISPLVIYAKDGQFVKWLNTRNIKNIMVPFQMTAYPKIYSLKSIFTFVPRLIRNLLQNYFAKVRLVNIARDFKPDIIHTNIGPTKLGYEVSKKLKIKHVWHIREYQKLDFNIDFYPSFSVFKNLIKKSYCICITKGLQDYFELGENSRTIYDGVLEEDDAVQIENKENYFLFVGRLEKAKGLSDLIDAFYIFSKKQINYKLLVAGDGQPKYVSQIKDQIENYGLSNKIELLGFRTDRLELMQRAKALIVPSINEGFGFITAEAMFCGTMVIGRYTGGTKEIIENSQGSAKQFLTKEELVKQMVTISNYENKTYCREVSQAQKIAVRLYSKTNHANEVLKYYNDILKN